uniref:Uncharacterized protein n=1 Tax=Cacopsylla melanoneura TaxID=428564 RepID=A0A8D9F5E8_9HEMI
MVVKPTVDDNSGEILPSEYEIEELYIESVELCDADDNNNNTQETEKKECIVDEPKWNSYTPAMLKKMRSRKLMTKTPAKRKRNCEQYSDNLASKKGVLSLQELHVQKMLEAQAREDAMKEEKHKATMDARVKKDLHLTRMLEMQETDKKRKEEIHQAEMDERAIKLKIYKEQYAAMIKNNR